MVLRWWSGKPISAREPKEVFFNSYSGRLWEPEGDGELNDKWSSTKRFHCICHLIRMRVLIWPYLSALSLQEEFIRGALAQLEVERDEAMRRLEEEHRLHMAARHQAAVALSLEHQHHSHTPDHHDHQHSHCEHSHEHSGKEDKMVCLSAILQMWKAQDYKMIKI